jgi:predicted metal-dependent enzyme (double-stranded beta helix superfamily)
MAAGLTRFRNFVVDVTKVVSEETKTAAVVERVRVLLGDLVAHDDWLPDEWSQPNPTYYRQYLLHCDPLERFSVISFVWGVGQSTPVHDHTVWGVVGVLRGAELNQTYRWVDGRQVAGECERLQSGKVTTVGPDFGDLHKVTNAVVDGASVSIHVYGGNIGAVRRHVYDLDRGAIKDFVSGYSNAMMPNIWDRSAEMRAR